MSIGLAAKAVQPAVYTLLHGDSTLLALAAVYDEPPEGSAFPYVVIGDFEEKPANRMGGKVGKEVTITVEAWTEARGAKSIQAILARVDALLDNALTLSVTGYTVERLDHEQTVITREAILRRGTSRYACQVVET